MSDAIRAALEPLRGGFQADGADLELVEVDGGDAVILLRIDDEAACADDCLLPKATLEPILLAAIQSAAPEIERVRLIDPREGAAAS